MGVITAGKAAVQSVKTAQKARAVDAPLAQAAAQARASLLKLKFGTPAADQKSLSAGTRSLTALNEVRQQVENAAPVTLKVKLPAAAKPHVEALSSWQSPKAMDETRLRTLQFLRSPQGQALDDASLSKVAEAYSGSVRKRSTRAPDKGPDVFPTPSPAAEAKAVGAFLDAKAPRFAEYEQLLKGLGFREVSSDLPHGVRFENRLGQKVDLPRRDSDSLGALDAAELHTEMLHQIRAGQSFKLGDAKLSADYKAGRSGAMTYAAPAHEPLKASLHAVLQQRPRSITAIEHPAVQQLLPGAKMELVSTAATTNRPFVSLSVPDGVNLTPQTLSKLELATPPEVPLHLRFKDVPKLSLVRWAGLGEVDNTINPRTPRIWASQLSAAQQRTTLPIQGTHREWIPHTSGNSHFGVGLDVHALHQSDRVVVAAEFLEEGARTLPLNVKLEALRKVGRELSAGTHVPVEFRAVAGVDEPLRFVGGREV